MSTQRCPHPRDRAASARPLFRTPRGWLVATLIALYAVGIFWGLPSEVNSTRDSTSMYASLGVLARFNDPEFDYAYPQVHKLLLATFTGSVLAGAKLTGHLGTPSGSHPYGLTHPVETISLLFVIARFVSCVMAAFALMLVLQSHEASERARLYTMALLGLSGVMTYYARTGNYDVPYVFWWAASVALLHRYFEGGARWSLWLAGGCLALSVGTKDQAIGLVLGTAIPLLVLGRDEDRHFRDRLRNAFQCGVATVIGYGVVILLSPPARWLRHLESYGEVMEGAGRADPRSFSLSDLAVQFTGSLHDLLGVGALALAVLGLVVLSREGRLRRTWIVVGPVLGYLVVPILVTRFAPPRFLIPVALALGVFIATGVDRLLAIAADGAGRRLQRIAGSAFLVFLLIGELLRGYVPYTWLMTFDNKRRVSAEIAEYVAEGEPILFSHGSYRQLPNADIYTRYVVVTPEDVPLSRPAKHVAIAESEAPEVVAWLTAQDLGASAQRGGRTFLRVASWTHPALAKQFTGAREQIAFEYFLYLPQ